MTSSWLDAARGAVRDLGMAVIPVGCPGCGQPDVRICPACLLRLSGAPQRCEHGAVRLVTFQGDALLPVWTRAAYTETSREVILGWKGRGRRDLDTLIARQLCGTARFIAPALATLHITPAAPLWVVPIPSTRAATRKRGSDLVAALADAVATCLRDAGVAAAAAPVLRRRGRTHQAGLSLAGRSANRSGRLWARRTVRPGPVLVVDDIVTTGASIRQAATFLAQRGAVAVAGLVVAATPRPHQ